MEKYIDIHTHKRTDIGLSIVNQFANKIEINTIFDGPVSIGLHPWHLREANHKAVFDVLEQLSSNKEVFAIGECGLDRSVSINFENQIKYFLMQNDIAIKNEMPLIIHSVKTYSDFLQLMKEGKMNTPWIFHGFRGNYQIARRMIDFGAYISLGSQIMRDDPKLVEVVKKIPLQRLFLETDESEIGIELIYERAAQIRNINIIEFVSHIYQNFIYCFNYGIR